MKIDSTVDLDNLDSLKAVDKSDMLSLLEDLPGHISDAIKLPVIDLDGFQPSLIAVVGMGGSAISGDIIDAWLFNSIKVPITVVRGYELPEMINETSLVFAVSFSGNTEETLSATEEALNRKARIITISKGGKLEELAKSEGIPHIQISCSDKLVPRAALGYLLIPIIMNLAKNGLIPDNEIDAELDDVIVTLRSLRESLKPSSSSDANQAKQIAQKLSGQVPLIYSYHPFKCISYRWRTQLNENSKVLARSVELPEMNHNDIVGWMGDDNAGSYTIILLRDLAVESKRMEKRIELTKDLAFSKARELIEVYAAGKYTLSKMLSLMYIGDFTSVYLALIRGIDPTPVEIIDKLKELMAD
jgi:glucose/mannose-6-phosphate isomerase